MIKALPLTTIDEICAVCKFVASSTGTFVELGTRFGGTSSLIARLFPERAVLTINIATEHGDAFAGLDNVTFIQANSQAGPMSTMSIGVLFVDAEHTPGAVQVDISRWSPQVEPGGFVIVHDSVLRDELSVSVGGVQLSHKNAAGEDETGYPEIGEIAKHILSDGWTLVDTVDSALIFHKEFWNET